MYIDKHKAVSLHYTLTTGSGDIVESTRDQEPLNYIHGIGMLLRHLEAALKGKSAGDHFQVILQPEQAYGQHDKNRVHVIPREIFQTDTEITEGMVFQGHTDHGVEDVTVIDVKEHEITVDANHPLAGQTLHFDIEILDVHDASQEELEAQQGTEGYRSR